MTINTDRETQAQNNITKKILMIRTWYELGIPVQRDIADNELYREGIPCLYQVPKTIDGFRRWKDSDLNITSTNQVTFEKYFNTPSNEITLVQLKRELHKLKLKFDDQLDAFSTSGLKRLQTEIKNKKDFLKVQNDEIDDLLREQKDLKIQIADIILQMRDMEMVHKVQIEDKNKEIQRLNGVISRLRLLRGVANE